MLIPVTIITHFIFLPKKIRLKSLTLFMLSAKFNTQMYMSPLI